jgi:hypothetical protein
LKIIDQFGGKKQYIQALKELEQELYKTGAWNVRDHYLHYNRW